MSHIVALSNVFLRLHHLNDCDQSLIDSPAAVILISEPNVNTSKTENRQIVYSLIIFRSDKHTAAPEGKYVAFKKKLIEFLIFKSLVKKTNDFETNIFFLESTE